jgi:uncharacterized membrane protein YfcA
MPMGRRQKGIWIALVAAVIAAVIVGLVSGVLVETAPAHIPRSLVIVLLAALIGVVLAACIPWWRRLDDMAREAHLTAWYWGGHSGSASDW